MKQYQQLLTKILNNGSTQTNRTGVDTIATYGQSISFDLTLGFPAITTKKLAFNSAVAEFLGHFYGFTNAEQFRQMGTKVWDVNANDNQQWLNNPHRKGEDDLGPIYGKQWRSWDTSTLEADTHIDQLEQCLNLINTDPGSRRIILTAWNPADISKMALPPCHAMYQFSVNQQRRDLYLTVYMRSCDVFLGLPFNLVQGALMLELFARFTNCNAKGLTYFLADAHIYESHLGQVEELLRRTPYELPILRISDDIPKNISSLNELPVMKPSDFRLNHYMSWPSLKADMAV